MHFCRIFMFIKICALEKKLTYVCAWGTVKSFL